MTLEQTMAELKSLGTAQNRKVYTRHGYGENMFGVSFANLNKLGKKIKRDHPLAARLWATGNEDARMLAIMIADPEAITSKQLDAWVREIRHYVLADVFVSRLAGRSPYAPKKAAAWIRSRREFVGQAGWNLVAGLAMRDDEAPDEVFEKHLETIEKKIAKAPNRVRHAMNGALIAIGIRNGKLKKLAQTTAARIGKVEVDHGQTNCKTPAAIPYIDKAWARKAKKKTPRQ